MIHINDLFLFGTIGLLIEAGIVDILWLWFGWLGLGGWLGVHIIIFTVVLFFILEDF